MHKTILFLAIFLLGFAGFVSANQAGCTAASLQGFVCDSASNPCYEATACGQCCGNLCGGGCSYKSVIDHKWYTGGANCNLGSPDGAEVIKSGAPGFACGGICIANPAPNSACCGDFKNASSKVYHTLTQQCCGNKLVAGINQICYDSKADGNIDSACDSVKYTSGGYQYERNPHKIYNWIYRAQPENGTYSYPSSGTYIKPVGWYINNTGYTWQNGIPAKAKNCCDASKPYGQSDLSFSNTLDLIPPVCNECPLLSANGRTGYGCSATKTCCNFECIDPNNIISSTNEKCHALTGKVNVNLDEKYIEKTEKERGFRPNVITPFDDIICELKTSDSQYISRATAKIITYDENGNEIEIQTAQMNPSASNPNKFIANIKGWSDGWTTDQNKIKKIITSKKIICVAKITLTDNTEKTLISKEKEISTCLKIYGNANSDITINHMYGKIFGEPITKIITLAENNKNIISSIEPFKTHQSRFSYYVDLVEHPDNDWTPNKESFTPHFKLEDERTISTISSCQKPNAIETYLFYTKGIRSHAFVGERKIFINVDENTKSRDNLATTFIHEFAHAFAGIRDEYTERPTALWYTQRYMQLLLMFKGLDNVQSDKNCQKNTDIWAGYGDSYRGCLRRSDLKRPSDTSIMNYGPNVQFNVVSCGYILSTIHQDQINDMEKTKQNWEECMKIDGVIKPTS